MAQFLAKPKVNLLGKLERVNLGTLMTGDKGSHKVLIELYEGSEKIQASGNVDALAIRGDGASFTYSGQISDGNIIIEPVDSVYGAEGNGSTAVRLKDGVHDTVVIILDYYMSASTTDTIIIPGETPVHDLPELLDRIDEMVEKTEAAEDAAESATSAASSANTAATAATNAAGSANTAAQSANTAASSASSAATAATNAAAAANTAADAIPKQIVSTTVEYARLGTAPISPTTSGLVYYENYASAGIQIGDYFSIRTHNVWDSGDTTDTYAICRYGLDGSGAVSTVNGISPDANGNVTIPVDSTPTQNSTNPVTSGGVYTALANIDQTGLVKSVNGTSPDSNGNVTLPTDATPTTGSTNFMTSGAIKNALIDAAGIVDLVYPVGAIYISANSVNPGTLFSGTTWEQITDAFLLAGGGDYTIGATGGEAEHEITIAEMPSHTHGWKGRQASSLSSGSSPVALFGSDPADDQIALGRGPQAAGGSEPMSLMPPYLAVNIWKRTA